MGDCWYLVLQCATDSFDLLECLTLIFWLALAIWQNLVITSWAAIPNELYFGSYIYFYSEI